MKHILTAEDFVTHPELKDAGFQIDQEVEIQEDGSFVGISNEKESVVEETTTVPAAELSSEETATTKEETASTEDGALAD